MRGKLLQYEFRSTWKGFGTINILMLITVIAGVPITIGSNFASNQVSYSTRANYSQLALLSLLALLGYGLYQLFRELYVAPSGLIFTVPTDMESILMAKLKSSCLLAGLSFLMLYALGHIFKYFSTGSPPELLLVATTIVYLATCSYSALLSVGFRDIALAHKRGLGVAPAITATIKALLLGFMALALYFTLNYFILGVVLSTVRILPVLFAFLLILGCGIVLVMKAKGYVREAAELLAPQQEASF